MTEEQRQSAKEKAVLLALQKDMALIRRDLEIHGMKKDGSTVFISKSKDYDSLWQDAWNELQKGKPENALNDKIEHFEGAEGIKRLFERTLENKEKVLRTILSDKPLVYLAGKDFSNEYMNKRRDSGIFLKSLRLFSRDVDRPEHKDYSKYNKEVKVASEDLKFDDSLVIWDDYVAIVNSENKTCVLINNQKNANIMKKWFDFVWSKST